MKTRKPYSMKWKVMRLLIWCWLLPLCLFTGGLGLYTGTRHMNTTAHNYQEQLSFDTKIIIERLNLAITDSRKASYDGEILRLHGFYQEGVIDQESMKKGYVDYLNSTYGKNKLISNIYLWSPDELTQLLPADDTAQSDIVPAEGTSIYNETVGGSYAQTRLFWQTDYQEASELAQSLGTSTGFLVSGKKLYLVRNMMDSSYHVQCILVFDINQSYIFESISGNPMMDTARIAIGEESQILFGDEDADAWAEFLEDLGSDTYEWQSGRLLVSDQESGDGYKIMTAMRVKNEVTMYPFYGYPFVVAGMLISMLLMLLVILGVFRREVTMPVERLVEGMQQIENGELGYQITDKPKNLEFSYLTDVTNHMSRHLQEQVLKSYQEELALREARIMALQSHINPHFLNNTLETINWEARLGGNEKVSKMIEALSTVMDAAMDRRKKRQVTLREEMGYVSCYLYIMTERLGSKLHIETQIPEELMDCLVPRLILQPVIENAIEHGVMPNGSGTVRIIGRSDEEFIYLETYNDGELTEENRERIDRLLDPDYINAKEPTGNLGIANVNLRLRILFGEHCGLTIVEEDGGVLARMKIRRLTQADADMAKTIS